MASVEKLPSGRYRAVYYLASRPGEKPRKRRVKGTFTHKRAAERAATEAEGRAIGDPQHDPDRGRMTWGAWETTWTPTRRLAARTARTAECHTRLRLRPRWGEVELVEITHHDVQQWANDLVESGLAASTVRQAVFHFSASMKAALRAGHVRANPVTGVVLPILPTGAERFLRDDEVDRLVERLAGVDRVLVEVLLETGIRLHEAVGLHWARVDFDARSVLVTEVWEPDADPPGIRPHTKGEDARSVPLTDRLAEVLRDWARTRPPAATCGQHHGRGSTCRSGLVLVDRDGGPLDGDNFRNRGWRRAVRGSKVGPVRIHDLRHTWASRLVTAGVPLERVQRWAGHGSVAVTQRYAKLMDDGADLYRDALARRASTTSRPTLRAVE